MRIGTFRDSQLLLTHHLRPWHRHSVRLNPEPIAILNRTIPRNPYVPQDPILREEHANEVLQIQVAGLVKRLQATKVACVVIGVSGGLDSTLALLVATRAFDILGWDRGRLMGVSMPGFGTSTETRSNAMSHMNALRIDAREIDICDASLQMLRDILHPAANGEEVWDVTYENVQAGARTSILFRLANQLNGLVVGTSNLSELALGWSTYGVGDQMSHYAVNSSVPKTLVKVIVDSHARDQEHSDEIKQILLSIVETPISPKLVPL